MAAALQHSWGSSLKETAHVVDPVKLGFQKAKAYKNTQVNPDSEIVPSTDEIA
ncbi:hypothetical protein CCACVL1_13806 [Corchorus capsularis]|uniref:Uncharacterized protein n=1 Tax=Corchorus capsularis TaxID=210143 RepID=A0A1R3I9M0_COCAP|nr:hypothetical protein CCACVL1_13806 [Corchorus capsularis]